MPERTAYAPGTPCWVDLTADDPDRIAGFYAEVLGVEAAEPQMGTFRTLTKDGRAVAAVGAKPAPEAPTAWTMYVAVQDAEATAAKAVEIGGTVVVGAGDVGDLGRLALLADPGGAVFGLWQAGTHAGAALVNEPGALCWNELATPERNPAVRFYSGLFGWEAQEIDMGGSPYTTFSLTGTQDAIAGLQVIGGGAIPEGVPPHWGTAFAVADTDAAVAAAQRLGGAVDVPPTDMPIGRFAVLRDPEGGAFSVMALAEEPES